MCILFPSARVIDKMRVQIWPKKGVKVIDFLITFFFRTKVGQPQKARNGKQEVECPDPSFRTPLKIHLQSIRG